MTRLRFGLRTLVVGVGLVALAELQCASADGYGKFDYFTHVR